MQMLILDLLAIFQNFQTIHPGPFPLNKSHLTLLFFREDSTSTLAYKSLHAELCSQFPYFKRIYTDGSKSEEGIALVAYCSTGSTREFSKRIPSDSSIYMAELTALLLALKMIYQSRTKNFLIFSDSLSALEAIAGRNLNHPELLNFLKSTHL